MIIALINYRSIRILIGSIHLLKVLKTKLKIPLYLQAAKSMKPRSYLIAFYFKSRN